jgi:hypothetical protein
VSNQDITGPIVGNEFVARRVRPTAQLKPTESSRIVAPVLSPVAMGPTLTSATPLQFTATLPKLHWFSRLYETFHAHTVMAFAIVIVLLGLVSSQVLGDILAVHSVAATALTGTKSIAGLNLSLPTSQLSSRLKQIEQQPLQLTVGTQKISVPATAIASWLKLTHSGSSSQIHVESTAIATSLQSLAAVDLHAPTNQVTVTHPDGTSHVIAAGSAGQVLGDVSGASQQLAKNLLSGAGGSLNLPIKNQAALAVTPSAYPKLLEVDLTTKRMYAWQNGQLIRTFLVSAGKPTTPTPVGQFKIWEKLPMQTMTGFNPDGSKYVQPNVQWINYFDHDGDAVHGNYWRPLSVFGNVNTSHGCVSTVDTDAEWIYNWAPVGTTVITYN